MWKTSRWLCAATCFGTAARLCAHLAAHPARGWIEWVLNWAALWIVLPLLAGRASRRGASAFALAGALGGVEVISYYGVEHLVRFKVDWIVIGGLFSALAGLLGYHGRCTGGDCWCCLA